MTKTRLILADDNKDFRDMLKAVLKEAGYEVLTAANGIQALRLCDTHEIGAAIVDLVMPEKEGLETIVEMSRRFPHIKTIAITGGGRGPSKVYLETARRLGARAALAKPFAVSSLLHVINELLLPDSSSAGDTAT
jgi:DNA-binding NtrC family response regulator